jgi:hypothetical protein
MDFKRVRTFVTVAEHGTRSRILHDYSRSRKLDGRKAAKRPRSSSSAHWCFPCTYSPACQALHAESYCMAAMQIIAFSAAALLASSALCQFQGGRRRSSAGNQTGSHGAAKTGRASTAANKTRAAEKDGGDRATRKGPHQDRTVRHRDPVVWANTESHIYHYATSKTYGHTKVGAYMCEKETAEAGVRAAKNEKHP